MTPMERFNVIAGTPKGASRLIDTILDEYGAADLLNAFFPGLTDAEQQRLIDLVHRRMFAEENNKIRVHDYYTYNGQRKTLREHCIEAKLPENAVVKRLCRGWSIQAALETPLKHCNIQPGTCGL